MKLDLYFQKDSSYDHLSFFDQDEPSVEIEGLLLYSLSEKELAKIPFYNESDLTNNFKFTLIDGQIDFRRKYTFDQLIADKITYRIKTHPYFNFITLPKISSPATQEEYFAILKLTEDLENKDSDLSKLCAWKADLISKMSSFYRIAARVMQIKNGAAQNIIVNQDFANNLNSAIIQANSNPDKVYLHRVRDDNDRPVIIDGKPVIIKLNLDALKTISTLIEVRRGYCACNEAYHAVVITSLNAIQDYNYLTDDLGNPYKPASLIKIDDNGNIIS